MNNTYIPTVAELLAVPVEENGEEFVKVSEDDGIRVSYHNSKEMVDLLGEQMILRASVVKMLSEAGEKLAIVEPDYQLCLFYAYRALEVQRSYYEGALLSARNQFPEASESDVLQFAHILAANPEVAGHPTGGAVDVTLYDREKSAFVDMGVELRREVIRKAGKKIYTFSPEVSSQILERRVLLRDLMSSVGFAPFNGEFWHFSYGDREWATFLRRTKAFYNQVLLSDIDL